MEASHSTNVTAFIVYASLAVALLAALHAVKGVHGAGSSPMFVFGSSYVDTGNVNNPDSARPYPWSKPYGETWPGRPSGRYSNGRVLTDILATALNRSSPPSYAKRGTAGRLIKAGLNFASGGSGVLSGYGFPPISSQIDAFQSVASSSLYTPQELASAIVLYATAGDDYFHYLTVQNSPLTDIYPLTVNVGKQISNDLVRLYALGLRKFVVTYLPPIGCLPIASSSTTFQHCNDSWSNNVAQAHNARVFKNVLGLRHYFTNGSIVLLDLYTAFSSAQSSLGSSLKPCCVGNSPPFKCSNLDSQGQPAYTLCPNPSSLFYWDDIIHPSEAGWQAIVKQLSPSLVSLHKW